ncbi:hypothetical protein CDG77_18830 [Nostoc sp. 'Peltigera membranacea cyanobiont' 213]|uniref:hypothetical protein n=1 Tax=unclassified Nostoc TaxID=2593658 RepID=UPI000B95B6D8|nr:MULTISPECIES: hypothetical protein [unclassified Nostoc]AVH65928.1 hypothetical protein NPM_4394 [Nostoc sp. 'Peltigera membranacea cyanobiont' N6]OYD89428.1 hypothetical protein CDG77_18830 [Nostoc sp. 'Peltigera membranacea cyanobiont' 213]
MSNETQIKDQNSIQTRNRNATQPQNIQNQARGLLNNLVSSVQTLVYDITALEVNTMVVDRINASKFNAWEAYQEIYSIHDPDYFEAKGIPEEGSQAQELRKRYKSLFNQLEREYFYLLLEEGSGFYNPQDERIKRYRQRLEYAKKYQPNLVEADRENVKLAEPILPAPTPVLDDEDGNNQQDWIETFKEIQILLNNDKFGRTLRKMSELKAALDSSNVQSTKIDIIYAQTVMQLDGDIITRYHKELFNLPEEAKNLIINTHNQGVISGEKQWRGTFSFLISLIQGIANLARQ